MDDRSRAPARSTALVAQPQRPRQWAPDPILAGHLTCLAAASGYSPPQILPGAAVHLLCVSLPLKTARQRKAALAFAVEAFLAAPLEQCQLALGPELAEGQYLCAIADRSALAEVLEDQVYHGPVVPDYLAVPSPFDPEAWSLWCGEELVFLRFSDGGGLALLPDALPDLWRAQGRPELHLWHGTPPAGVRIARHVTDAPLLDPDILKMDLRPETHRRSIREWRTLGRFTLIAAMLTAFAQIGLLHLDAVALERTARDRAVSFQMQLSQRGLDVLQANQSTEFLLAALTRSTKVPEGSDPFLSLLSRTAASVPETTALEFRELRFDSAAKALSVLINARDLEALQRVETGLRTEGLDVTSGAATRTGAGAEMEIVISEIG
ncbi:type II secretion system protein GspL [Sulfitobacter sp. JB4-11]|uniref:type II secretion system protein GspL n=1 Tax=Sulfitobacter rhodophyticola TaxID=3238304 RepID=UPI003D8139AE